MRTVRMGVRQWKSEIPVSTWGERAQVKQEEQFECRFRRSKKGRVDQNDEEDTVKAFTNCRSPVWLFSKDV